MVPTAEEVYNDFHFNYKGDGNLVLEAMKEFAKLHVQECKKKILKNVKTILTEDECPLTGQEFEIREIDKNSIINAYSLENIK